MSSIVKLLLPAIALCAGCAGAQTAKSVSLATDDTIIRIQPTSRGPALASLRYAPDGRDWVAPTDAQVTFLVDEAEIQGKTVALRWRCLSTDAAGTSPRWATLIFVCDDPPLRGQSIWQAFPGRGPVEHRFIITNGGGVPVVLPRQTSLKLATRSTSGRPLESFWIDKGAGRPTDIGVHRTDITAGFKTSILSTPYGGAIPFTAVQERGAALGWYAGIEFSGRVSIDLTAADSTNLEAEIGLAAEKDGAGYRTILAPGESVESPPVFIGCYRGDLDDAGNRLRRWIAKHLRPPAADMRYPLLTNNSWGSGMAVDEKLARRMIDDSAELGIEMFGVDAGWFRWVGDWTPNPAKFPNGLSPIADYVHANGLKFGLWVGWTQGGDRVDPSGNHQVLSVNDPAMKGWFARDYPPDWKPADFTGADVCLADARARQWCLDLLRRLVRENQLDMIEHDQRMIVDKCFRPDHGHSASRGDVAYHAAKGYYHIYDSLRKENPNLLFEDCVNGGNMVDFGVVRRVHYISITDSYDPLSNRRAFYDASYVLPPAMCECYVANHPGSTPANFKYMLRSGMMGWCTIMLDMSQWTPQQRQAAKHEFEVYKTRIRPLINSANLYHISDRPDGVRFDGMQYIDPTTGKGLLFAFRGTTADTHHTFVLKGLDPAGQYELSFEDGNVATQLQSGADLMRSGIDLILPEPQSSQLVYLIRR